jgi:integrase
MCRSEILGLRWRNADLENNTLDVIEQLPFGVPPKTKTISYTPLYARMEFWHHFCAISEKSAAN